MPARLFLSSGDLMADRRFEFARDLRLKGDFAAAADLIDFVGHLLGRSLTAGVVDHDLGPRTAQLFAYRGPYAPASARNDRNRPLQVQNGLPFRRVCFRIWRLLLPFPARSKLCVQRTQNHDDSRMVAGVENNSSPQLRTRSSGA